MRGQKSQQLESYSINFMIEEDNVLFTVISTFEFWIIGVGLFFVSKTGMDINTDFLSDNFVVLVDVFLVIDEGFEFVLECVDKVISFIELLLSVPGVLPEGRGLENGGDFCK